ncbi:MAG: FMN-binding protein [Bacillota bacterium]
MVLAAVVVGGTRLQSSIRELRSLTVGQVDLSQVRDGEYEGEFDGGLVKAKVRVRVSGHRLTDLAILRHDTGLGRKAQSIVNTVVQAQSLSVDAIAEATYSSKVILKATGAT